MKRRQGIRLSTHISVDIKCLPARQCIKKRNNKMQNLKIKHCEISIRATSKIGQAETKARG